MAIEFLATFIAYESESKSKSICPNPNLDLADDSTWTVFGQ